MIGVIPTTSLPIPITRLKERRRVPACYMALDGDFRPLALSEDYDRFVKGPLQAVLDAPESHELSLGAEIDSGRSWELPVLIAHWLKARDISDAPLFWATGMVDADLSPLPGDYHIPTKIAISRAHFADWKAQFGRVVAVLPPMEPDAAAEAKALFAAEGIEAHVIESFDALEALLNTELGRSAPAQTPPAKTETSTPQAPWRTRYWAGGGALAVLLAAAAVGSNNFGSALSTLTGSTDAELETNRKPVDPALSIFGLYAEDKSACIDKTMSGAPLDLKAGTQTVTGVSLQTGPGLCGLEFRNHGTATVAVTLGADLVGHAIPGSQSATAPIPLAPDQSWQVIFARTPAPLQSQTQISAGDETRQVLVVLE